MSGADPGERPKVGYRQPPPEHRFKKGVSGNPNGRPKRRPHAKPAALNFADQAANQLLLQDAYRRVKIREGDKSIEVTAIAAVHRSIWASAVKGNRGAQRLYTDMVQKIENSDRQSRAQSIEESISYKYRCERAIKAAKAAGNEVPEPVPHPDDMVIDHLLCSVSICGPTTDAEKVEWDRRLEHRDDAQEAVSYQAKAYRSARNPDRKAAWLERWKQEQSFYDRLNDNLPKRYRKELKDRCVHEGATVAGSQRTTVWAGEQ